MVIVGIFFSTIALPGIYCFIEFINERDFSFTGRMKGIAYSCTILNYLFNLGESTSNSDFMLYYFALVNSISYISLFVYDLGCLARTSSMRS